MVGVVLVVLIIGCILLRPGGPDGRPLVSFGTGFFGRHVLPPVVVGLAAAGALAAWWAVGLVG